MSEGGKINSLKYPTTQKMRFFASHYNPENNLYHKKRESRDRLAQTVERALRKFTTQRNVVRALPVPGFFQMQLIAIYI